MMRVEGAMVIVRALASEGLSFCGFVGSFVAGCGVEPWVAMRMALGQEGYSSRTCILGLRAGGERLFLAHILLR
jgi:hypothetical protein